MGRLLAGPRSHARGCASWPVEAGIAPGNRETKGSEIDSSVSWQRNVGFTLKVVLLRQAIIPRLRLGGAALWISNTTFNL